jgi:CrcB protein
MNYLLVMLGGAIGSAARYQVGRWTLGWMGPNYPWGTLTVNIVGGVLMGLLVGALARISVPGENWRLFAAIGVLGGFTTFSSFALDTGNMMQRGDLAAALGDILLSGGGAILGVFAGLAIVRALA